MSGDVLEIIRSRRTVHTYTDRPVSQEAIDLLLEAAMYAPSRLNRRPWHFVVIRDAAVRRRMAEALRVGPYLVQAPVALLVCGTPDTSPTWLMDLSAAIENLLLAATELGLGTSWVGAPGTVMWDRFEDAFRVELGVPERVRLAALVAIGYPAERPPPHSRSERYDPTRVHCERWETVSTGPDACPCDARPPSGATD